MKKLTKDEVKALKADIVANKGKNQEAIAAKYNVSRSLVSNIATGRRHKDVTTDLPVNVRGGQTQSEYDPTDERVLELESEIISLRDERNRERAKYNKSAKEGGVFRAMAAELRNTLAPLPALPAQVEMAAAGSINEHLVMHLSDGHHDQTVRSSECGGLEEYNFPISCARAERYVDTVLDWTQSTLRSQFHFPHLWILAYGDHTSGEIHGAMTRSYYANMFKNCLAIGQLHALMYRDLAAHFENVHILYLPGNHGRRSPQKDFHGAQNNWDYLVAETARLHCRDMPNLDFLIPDAYSCNLNINGHGFNVSHGDDVRGNAGIPWYGLTRRQKSLMALNSVMGGHPLRYFVIGHHHTSSTLSDLNGEMIVNGAWPGSDSYAYNSFVGYREPCQLIHGVHEKYGVTWRLPVKLKHASESRGPQRYKIAEHMGWDK